MKTYDEYREIVEKHLMDYVPQVDVKVHTLYESMKYSLMSGGKRIRPVLLLAATDFGGGDIYEALPYACALEYIHTYSLIHDDLPAMDNDDLRRGNPTNHKVYGEDIAILAGDGLLNTACEVMFRDLTYFFDDATKLKRHAKAGLAITKAAGINGMIGGQLCDVENQFRQCSSEMVDFIDANKTGQLLKAPIVAGLSICGADQQTLHDFTTYAELIGKAFQVSDDILDVIGDAEALGKATGKDADLGKANYAVVNGVEKAEEFLHELTVNALASIEKYGDKADFFKELAEKLEARRS